MYPLSPLTSARRQLRVLAAIGDAKTAESQWENIGIWTNEMRLALEEALSEAGVDVDDMDGEALHCLVGESVVAVIVTHMLVHSLAAATQVAWMDVLKQLEDHLEEDWT